jgi:glycine hydroxymethyltransferase
MKEPEMTRIAELIANALRGRGDEAKLAEVRAQVAELCAKFPVYTDLP